MISLKWLCDSYFIYFNDQNINKLEELFSDNIKLEDWNISVKGKDDVLKEIQNIFDSVESLEILPREYYEDNSTVCCEIMIKINKTESIQVVDIITFDNLMKIKKIKAYKI